MRRPPPLRHRPLSPCLRRRRPRQQGRSLPPPAKPAASAVAPPAKPVVSAQDAKPAVAAPETAGNGYAARAEAGSRRPAPAGRYRQDRFRGAGRRVRRYQRRRRPSDKLRGAGLNAFTDTVSTDAGKRTRVRVGPAMNRRGGR